MLQYFSIEINTIMQIVPNSKRWKNIQIIDKGWSCEYKLKVINFFDIIFYCV